MTTLFDPLHAGELLLPNRIIMAPLTRCRASEGRVPNALMAEYYAQRASAGLIVSEATSVTPMGVGYPDTPGIWSEAQVDGWRQVTRAVHAAGGRIVLQLWHVGRVSHPDYLNGERPVSASAIPPLGHVSLLRPQREFVAPRALRSDELPGIVAAYRLAADHAKAAGFDGVEIHGANGYLLDQFLQDGSNQRDDAYGGSIANRARLALEVTDAICEVWGPGRVGYHIAPRCDAHSMGDSDPLATFTYLCSELGKRKLAFVFARESLGERRIGPALKAAFGGVYVVNEGFTHASAQQVLAAGEADAVSWGKAFISNPDLVRRLQLDQPLNPWDSKTFYGYGQADHRVGYTDYDTLVSEIG
jgi:N-ethylmaleimide reductase